jgi:hypothetical protein
MGMSKRMWLRKSVGSSGGKGERIWKGSARMAAMNIVVTRHLELELDLKVEIVDILSSCCLIMT